MSFFSEDRASELKKLFFETAEELLEALNQAGLALEKRPDDPEVVRSVRRTVHTLKGDSAACGYQPLSDLAHELEDVLTPQAGAGGALADLVFTAADTFHSMLEAYRNNSAPPPGDTLRAKIGKLKQGAAIGTTPEKFAPRFRWSEYHRMLIAAGGQGRAVYNVAVLIDRNCPMRAAAQQLVRNAFQQAGALLAISPEEDLPNVTVIEAAIASSHDADWIKRKCQVPAVVSEIVVRKYDPAATDASDDVLEVLSHPAVQASVPAALEVPKVTPAVVTNEEVPVVPSASPAPAEMQEPAHGQRPTAASSETSLRVESERIDDVLNLVGELVIGKSMLFQSISEFERRFPKDPLRAKFADSMAFQSRVLNDLQKSVMKIRMVPVEQLFRRFPRVVRDVAKAGGKEAELLVSGQDTDLDKSVLDTLAEPLTHLVRNAVDHGIETPEERAASGKPACGTVRLNAYHQGNQVVMEVEDDGRGIDRAKIVSAAIAREIVSAAEATNLSEAEALNLIFRPGFTTAAQVTRISGRGVGMDVVSSVLERLKGTIATETRLGQGTKFLIKVPLTLAIIKALMFRAGERLYAVPLHSVREIVRATEAEVHWVGRHEVLQLREQVLTLVRLGRLHRTQTDGARRLFIVVVQIADRKFGLIVDKLVGEEELVIKALDDDLVSTDLVSGASILGDGTVVLILNIPAVVARLGRAGAMPPVPPSGGELGPEPREATA